MSETGEGLHCLACGSDDLTTVATRAIGQTTRRRKRCKACRRTFYTREFPEAAIPDDAGTLRALMSVPKDLETGSCGRVR